MYRSIAEFGDSLIDKGITEVHIHPYIELSFSPFAEFHLKAIARNGDEFDECVYKRHFSRQCMLANDRKGQKSWKNKSEEWKDVLEGNGIRVIF